MKDLGPIIWSAWILDCKFENPETPVVITRISTHKSRLHAYLYMLSTGWVPKKNRRLYQVVEYQNDPGEFYDRDRHS